MTPALSDADIEALKNFQIKEFNNVFTIGMNSGVVSFYSQQCRAFQLAATLGKTIPDTKKASLRIAVLGGGVAGTTFWMAMQVLGFIQTEIFEATHQLLNRQSDSHHRFAHPSINEWPNVGARRRPFRSTTSWPFANWYASTAADVVQQLRNDCLLQQLLSEKDALVKFDHVIHRIDEAAGIGLVPWTRDAGTPR